MVLLMKKAALALILTIVLFSTVLVSQTLSSASANPGWKPWELMPTNLPSLVISSPINGESYASNDIWLNFTVEEPSDWLNKTDCYISYVTYCVDGDANGRGRGSSYEDGVSYTDENEVIGNVQDYGSAMNNSYSFSFKLGGLAAGKHTVDVCIEVNYETISFSQDESPMRSFTVYPSSPTPSPTQEASPASTPISTAIQEPTAIPEATSQSATFPATLIYAVPVGIALAVIGSLVYIKKRNNEKVRVRQESLTCLLWLREGLVKKPLQKPLLT